MGTPGHGGALSAFLSTLRTVAWGFLGLRKRSGHDEDMARIRPAHVIVAGLLGGVVFVLLLMAAVSLVARHTNTL